MSRGMSVFVNIGANLLPSLNTAAGRVERRFGQMNRSLRLEAAKTKVAYRELTATMKPLAAMAAPAVWRARREPGAQFLLAWLVPSWVLLK